MCGGWMWDGTRQERCEHTAWILNKRLLGRTDDSRQGVDNRIEVVLSRLSLSARDQRSGVGRRCSRREEERVGRGLMGR